MNPLFGNRNDITDKARLAPELNILVLEDNEDDFFLLRRQCMKSGLPVNAVRVDTQEKLVQALNEKDWDVVISDNSIPGGYLSIPSSLEIVKSMNKATPMIVVSGTISEDQAIKFLDMGISDYVLKDNLIRLVPVIKRILDEREERQGKIETEKKLSESKVRFNQLAESIRDMFFAIDKNLNCTYWNAAAEKMTGISASAALGKNIYDILPAYKGSLLERKFVRSLSKMESSTCEVCVEHNKLNRYLQVSFYPSREINSVMVKDITASKRIEEKLRATNEELSTFMYRVSHDIRGPVASLLGLANLARSEEKEGMASEYFPQSETMVHRLNEIVKALTHIAGIKTDPAELRTTALSETFFIVSKRINKRAHNARITFNNERDLIVRTDSRMLEIIFENIIQNSIDYARKDRETIIDITAIQTDRHTIITFVDNGMGISEQVVGKVFQMFFRGNESSKGSGLGLYLVKAAVEKLNGTVSINSRLNEGTRVTVQLPQLLSIL